MKSASKRFKTLVGGGFILLIAFTVVGRASSSAPPCTQPPFGLVSWWPGDGNANDIIGGNSGTLVGGTSFAAGEVSQAFRFNAAGDFVNVGTSSLWQLPGDFSVDTWIRTTATAVQNVMGAFVDGPTQWQFAINYADTLGGYSVGALRFLYASGGSFSEVFVANAGIFNGQFHHIAARRSGTTMDLFIDGVKVDTKTSTQSIGVDPNLELGRDSVPQFNFIGNLDEVEIFYRALTASEIQAIYDAGSAGKCNVTIDIKPGSFPNSINPRSKGKIPVAILTTDTFDATSVDPLTVLFGTTGVETAPVHSAVEDVDGDGETDLILHFKTQDTGIVCGDTSADLRGETFDGQPIRGSDSISTVGC